MEYIAALQMFIVTVLSDKGDFNFKSKKFNPLKVLINCILIGNIWFTAYLLNTIHRIQQAMEVSCPAILEKNEAAANVAETKKEK